MKYTQQIITRVTTIHCIVRYMHDAMQLTLQFCYIVVSIPRERLYMLMQFKHDTINGLIDRDKTR